MKRLFPRVDHLPLSFLICLLLFPVGCSSTGGGSVSRPPAQPMTAIILPDTNDDGLAEPRLRITVPFKSLVFAQQGQKISGGLEVVVVAWRDGQQVGGGVASRRVEFRHWAETRSDSLFSLDVKVPLDQAREVELEVRARSLDSSRAWSRRVVCHPEQWHSLPLVVTHWQWNLPDDGCLESSNDSLKIEVELSRVTGLSWPTGGLALELLLEGYSSSRVSKTLVMEEADFSQANSRVALGLARSELSFGLYRAQIRLLSNPGPQQDVRPWHPDRELQVLQPDWNDDQQWARQVAWLEGLFDSSIRKNMKNLPAPERAQAWQGLWDDPQAEKDHLLAILAADRRFSGPERGALTDRGRALIRYGQPRHVEIKGEPQGRYRSWEIWHYGPEGPVLSFLDSHGLGEFRLISTENP